MSRWTSPTESNAASMAAFMSGLAAATTSSWRKVPRRGRARRTLSEAIAIGCQYPLHAFGDMGRRQRRPGDVPDIAVDLERACAGLADKLRQPARAPDFASIGFPVLQDLDLMHGSGRREPDRVVDEEMFADDPIEDKEADHLAAGFGFPDPSRLDLGEVRRRR